MRKRWTVVVPVLAVLATVALASAHEAKEDLPAGPIRDRHELMKGIGNNAKIIGDAMKSGDFSPVGEAAEKIQASAAKILPLFPKGSTDPKSRAKPEIWTHWSKFEADTKDLEKTAAALAAAAKSGGGVPTAAKTMFGSCKSCHDQFRVPEKD